MVVEIFGHSGAGKSTLARELVRRFRCRGISAEVVDGRGSMNDSWFVRRGLQAIGLLAAPATALQGARLLQKSGGSWRAPGTLGGLMYRKRVIAKHHDPERMVVVDEGVLHGVWSTTLMGEMPSKEILDQLLGRLMGDHHALSYRPERSVVLERLRKGHKSRLRKMNARRAGALLDKQEAILDGIEDYMARQGRLLRVSDSHPEALEALTIRLSAML